MKEGQSAFERKAVSGQKNTYRKCQDKGGTKCLQFVLLWVVFQDKQYKNCVLPGGDRKWHPTTLFQESMLLLLELSFQARNWEISKYPLTLLGNNANGEFLVGMLVLCGWLDFIILEVFSNLWFYDFYPVPN